MAHDHNLASRVCQLRWTSFRLCQHGNDTTRFVTDDRLFATRAFYHRLPWSVAACIIARHWCQLGFPLGKASNCKLDTMASTIKCVLVSMCTPVVQLIKIQQGNNRSSAFFVLECLGQQVSRSARPPWLSPDWQLLSSLCGLQQITSRQHLLDSIWHLTIVIWLL